MTPTIQGQCYVMTANLDGETSLKTKDASPMTKHNVDQIKIDKIVSCIDCENPNPKLDRFLGRMSRLVIQFYILASGQLAEY
jgi:hypothetical protein